MKIAGSIAKAAIAALFCLAVIGCESESSSPTSAPTIEPKDGAPAVAAIPTPELTSVPTLEHRAIPEGVSNPCGQAHSVFGDVGTIEHFIHWTPDGSKIVFDDGSVVMMVNADRTGLRTVVDANPGFGFRGGFYAEVSPDGSKNTLNKPHASMA